MRDVPHQIAFTQLNVYVKAVAQAGSIFSKSIKYGPQIARRRADDFENFRCGGKLFQRLIALADKLGGVRLFDASVDDWR